MAYYTIEPVDFGINGQADKLSLGINGFAPSATSCMIVWHIGREEIFGNQITHPQTGEVLREPIVKFKQLQSGNTLLDGEDYEQWGENNYYVVEWLANKLNLVLIPDVPSVDEIETPTDESSSDANNSSVE